MKQQRRSSACNPEVYLCCREKRAGVRTKPLALAGLRVASARRVYCKGCDGTSWQTKNGGSLKIKFEVTASRHGDTQEVKNLGNKSCRHFYPGSAGRHRTPHSMSRSSVACPLVNPPPIWTPTLKQVFNPRPVTPRNDSFNFSYPILVAMVVRDSE